MSSADKIKVNNSKKPLHLAIILISVVATIASGAIMMRLKDDVKKTESPQTTTSLNEVIFENNSNDVETYNKYYKANELYRQGEFDAAIDVLSSLTSQNLPDSVIDLVYRLLADTYLAKGNFPNAAASLRSYQKTNYYSSQPSEVKQSIADEINKIDKGINTLEERKQNSDVE